MHRSWSIQASSYFFSCFPKVLTKHCRYLSVSAFPSHLLAQNILTAVLFPHRPTVRKIPGYASLSLASRPTQTQQTSRSLLLCHPSPSTTLIIISFVEAACNGTPFLTQCYSDNPLICRCQQKRKPFVVFSLFQTLLLQFSDWPDWLLLFSRLLNFSLGRNVYGGM